MLMVNTNQRPPTHTHTHTHTHTDTGTEHNTKENQHTTKEQKRKEIENYKNNWKTINKMAMRTYLSIISINVIRLKTSVKRHRVADCLQHTRHSFQITKDTQKLQGVDPCK